MTAIPTGPPIAAGARVLDIPNASKELDGAIDRLASAVGVLEERFGPYMRPPGPEVDTPNPAPDSACDFARGLRAHTNRIDNITATLERFDARLEL
jgi:hypothetical protein